MSMKQTVFQRGVSEAGRYSNEGFRNATPESSEKTAVHRVKGAK